MIKIEFLGFMNFFCRTTDNVMLDAAKSSDLVGEIVRWFLVWVSHRAARSSVECRHRKESLENTWAWKTFPRTRRAVSTYDFSSFLFCGPFFLCFFDFLHRLLSQRALNSFQTNISHSLLSPSRCRYYQGIAQFLTECKELKGPQKSPPARLNLWPIIEEV